MTARASGYVEATRLAFQLGFRVTDDGRCVSPEGRGRSPYVNPRRCYPQLSFRNAGKHYVFQAHQLCAFQQFGEATFGLEIQVRHLNGDSLDFRPSNIALGTAAENAADKTPDTRKRTALNAGRARSKLTAELAKEIVLLSFQGWTGKRLSAHFGVLRSTVSEILSGKIWSDATGLQRLDRKAPAPKRSEAA